VSLKLPGGECLGERDSDTFSLCRQQYPVTIAAPEPRVCVRREQPTLLCNEVRTGTHSSGVRALIKHLLELTLEVYCLPGPVRINLQRLLD
jgi:hypothetical protein